MEILGVSHKLMKRIKGMIRYASENPIDCETFLKYCSLDARPPLEFYEGRLIQVSEDLTIFFTIEQQPDGLCRHLRMSHNGEPPEDHVGEMFCRLFEFDLEDRENGILSYPHLKNQGIEYVQLIDIPEQRIVH